MQLSKILVNFSFFLLFNKRNQMVGRPKIFHTQNISSPSLSPSPRRLCIRAQVCVLVSVSVCRLCLHLSAGAQTNETRLVGSFGHKSHSLALIHTDTHAYTHKPRHTDKNQTLTHTDTHTYTYTQAKKAAKGTHSAPILFYYNLQSK